MNISYGKIKTCVQTTLLILPQPSESFSINKWFAFLHLDNAAYNWPWENKSLRRYTLEPPYARPPYSGSVDGVLGYGAWGERRRRSSRVKKSGSSVTTERAVSPVSCSRPRWWPCELQRTLALALYMSASKRAYFRTRFHSSKRQRVMRLPAAVRRTVESSSYGPDCLHSETLKDSLHFA